MSADDRCSVRDSSDDQPFRRKDAKVEPLHQERVVNGGDTDSGDVRDGYPSSPLRLQPSGNSVAAAITVTEHVARFQSFMDARRLAAMHEDGDRLDFVGARLGARRDTALKKRRKRFQLFGRNGATFVG